MILWKSDGHFIVRADEVRSADRIAALKDLHHPVPAILPDLVEQPQTRSVQQQRHELRHAAQLAQQGSDLVPREHDGKAIALLRMHHPVGRDGERPTQHGLVQKQQRGSGLVLRGRTDLPPLGEMREKRLHLARAHRGGMPATVKLDVTPYPGDVRLLGPRTVMPRPHGGAEPAQQSARPWTRR